VFIIKKITVSLVLSLAFLAAPAKADFSVSPISMILTPDGKASSGVIYVQNTANEPVALDMKVFKRIVDENGKEETPSLSEEEAKNFSIYPPLLSLKPLEKRIIRVSWRGSKEVKFEESYRLFVAQLPVKNFEKQNGKHQVNILMRYGVSLYVSPETAKPVVKIVSAKLLNSSSLDPANPPMMELVFKNSGTAHKNLTYYNLTLESQRTKKKVYYDYKTAPKILGPINIFPGKTRKVIVPWIKDLPKDSITATVEILD
jgi:fimbrial chaperone protein